MQKLIYRNPNGEEIDFTGGDFGVTKWSGFSKVDMDVQSQQVPFHDGSVFLDALLGDRELSVTVAVNDDNNLEKRYRLKREMIHCLNPKLGEGELIYTNDYTSKKIVCVPDIPEFDNKNMNDSGTMKAMCSFTASNPYWEDVEETELNINKGFFDIENNGDVMTNVRIEAYTNKINNLKIKNLENEQMINFQKEVDDNFVIDTNFGKKSIIEKSLVWENNTFDLFFAIKFITELNIFVGYGALNGIVLFSDDLINWKIEKVFPRNQVTDVIWDNEIKQFVYVDDGKLCYSKELNVIVNMQSDKIRLSTDGINWNEVYLANNDRFDYICYNSDLNSFLVSGVHSTYTSPDGNNWESHSQSTQIRNIEYYPNLKLYMGTDSNSKIYQSSDGINWIEYYDGANIPYIAKEILYNSYSDVYVAYCTQVTASYQTLNYIYISKNLKNWELINSLNFTMLKSLIFCSSMNLLVGVDYNGNTITSSNGIDWSDFSTDNLNHGDHFLQVIYSENLGLFVGVGNRIASSTDGINWVTRYSISLPQTTLFRICYSSDLNLFVAWGSSLTQGIIFTSSNGIDWNMSYVDHPVQDICYSSDLGLFVAVGYSSDNDNNIGIIFTSSNGIDWNMVSFPDISVLQTICYSSDLGLFVGMGRNYNETTEENECYSFTSTDGINWNFSRIYDENYPESEIYIGKICYSEKLNMFVACGNIEYSYTYIMTSSDAVNWVGQKFDNGDRLNGICFSDYLNMFVAVGEDGIIMTSFNGLEWDITYNSLYENLYEVCYSEKLNMFVITSGTNLLYSEFVDGENIIDYLTENSDMNLSIAVGKNKLIISGDGNLNIRFKYKQRYLGV